MQYPFYDRGAPHANGKRIFWHNNRQANATRKKHESRANSKGRALLFRTKSASKKKHSKQNARECKQQGHAFLLKTNSQTFKTKREGAEKLFRALALLAERRFIICFYGAQNALFSKTDIAGKNAPFLTEIRRLKTRFFK